MSTPNKNTFKANLFSPDNIASLEDVENALFELQSSFTEYNYQNVLDELLETPQLVELVLSDLSAIPLKSWLLEQFPAMPATFMSSFTSKLLSKLAVFFLFPPISFSQEVLDLMGKFHTTVKHGPAVLHDLFAMTFADEGKHREARELSKSTKGRSKSQWQGKQARRAAIREITVDPKPFAALELIIPSTCKERDDAMSDVLIRLKYILEYYLENISLPGIAQHLKEALIPKERPQELKIITDLPIPPETQSATTASTAVSAYPMIQPLSSALYFDSAEGFGEWRILVSSTAHHDLREARRMDKKIFKIICKKIKELSHGQFSPDNQKRLSGPKTEIPIFEAKMTRDLRLVYQVDCVPNFGNGEEQVLKLFGIYTHAQLDKRLWDSLSHQLDRKGKAYQDRCKYRNAPRNAGDNVFTPACFPMSDVDTVPPAAAPDLPPDQLSQLHSLLVLEKYITFSKELLHSMLADLDIAFPFEVSSQERTVIEHQYSCYVLGRSGTGKTTTMLFKMLWVERAFHLSSESFSKPRQLFVTQSRILTGKVEEYFSKLRDSLATSSCSPQELKLLAAKQDRPEQNLVDIDDATAWRSDLPQRYSQLEDRHFPLFLTFDRLCSMIEADITESAEVETFDLDMNYGDVNDYRQQVGVSNRSGSRVTYERFRMVYWRHFPEYLTKRLDPALVFSEIMGVILGSEATASTSCGYLDRDTYEGLSSRAQSTFSGQRRTVYDIFLRYLRKKRDLGDFDAADRTHAILSNIRQQGLLGQKIDQLYVDEVQDNLLIDALLLRSLCHNPNGLFWAGDTAQTISVGSSFRFKDLKAFLDRVEKQRRLRNVDSNNLYFAQQTPKDFHLAVNYRSHGGIVNCAQSVIDLITAFWPYSIDKLPAERGIVAGTKPSFFISDAATIGHEQFRHNESKGHIEFGANQCILVRDDAARERLQSQFGQIGIVLTLYESKGLEFNDVLLYDFFHDSSCNVSQWRVVLNTIETNAHACAMPAPAFDSIRHAGICSELKFLYVAITRARNRLWIADKSSKGEPMQTFWASRGVINDDKSKFQLQDLAVSSTLEEWATKGQELFDRKRYAQAKYCYEKAMQPRLAAVATAYYLREVALACPEGPSQDLPDVRMKAFTMAAEAFLCCARDAMNSPESYYHAAAGCFENAANTSETARVILPKAAQTYLLAKRYTNAAQLFRKAAMFDEVADILTRHPDKVEVQVAEKLKDVVRLKFITEKQFKKAHKLFTTVAEELEYLEDRNLDAAQVDLLTSHGREADAAELHLSEGRLFEAIDLFLQDQANPESSRSRAVHCILQGLWQEYSFGVTNSPNDNATRLLQYWDSHSSLSLVQDHCDEIQMFKAIMSQDFSHLVHLADCFFNRGNLPAALLCLDHYFSRSPALRGLPLTALTKTLRPFLMYVQMLHKITFLVDPCSNLRVSKVFGFRRDNQEFFVIPANTFLHQALQNSNKFETNLEDFHISDEDFRAIYRDSMKDRLLDRVTQQNDACRNALALHQPCLRYAAFGECYKPDCAQEHINSSTINTDWYNTWIQVHLRQILIYQTVRPCQFPREFKAQQRFWIGRLHHALNPPTDALGSSSNLKRELLEGSRRGFQVVMDWLRDLTYSLDFYPELSFLTEVMRAADLCFTFDKKQAPQYIYRSQFITADDKPEEYLRWPDGCCALTEVLASFEGKEPWSLRRGILFLGRILAIQLPIDLSVLCAFIERLAGSLVLFKRYRSFQNFHNITLPRSWLSIILPTFNPEEAMAKHTNQYWLFIAPLFDLITRIQTGTDAGHLLYGPELHSIRNEDQPIRGLFITRIMRAMCLLGYNINNYEFRGKIRHASGLLWRTVGRNKFSPLYMRCIYAMTWDEIGSAVRRSLKDSNLDNMVQLLQADRVTSPLHDILGVTRVVYTSIEGIPSLIDGSASKVQPPVPDRPATSVKREGDAIVADDTKMADSQHESNAVSHAEEEEDADDSEERDLDSSLPITDISQTVCSIPSERELYAVFVLQNAFRRALGRRREASDLQGLPASRLQFYTQCSNIVKAETWEHSTYKLCFLGPLPHLLACIDAIEASVLTAKNEITKRYHEDIQHEELEGLGSRLRRIVAVLKGIRGMKAKFAPNSDFHHRRSLEELAGFVDKALKLLRKTGVSEDLYEDMDLAFKGIVQVKCTKAQMGFELRSQGYQHSMDRRPSFESYPIWACQMGRRLPSIMA